MQADGPLTGAPLNFPSSGGGAAPARAILPVFDDNGFAPHLAYQVEAGLAPIDFIIQGENLTGITAVEVDRDVKVGGNGGDPPGVNSILVTDTAITVNVGTALSDNGDEWGVILRDGAGNVYRAPSPVQIFVPE